jgi:hypothetical protein
MCGWPGGCLLGGEITAGQVILGGGLLAGTAGAGAIILNNSQGSDPPNSGTQQSPLPADTAGTPSGGPEDPNLGKSEQSLKLPTPASSSERRLQQYRRLENARVAARF